MSEKASQCIIHFWESSKNLMTSQTIGSWEVLIEASKIQKDKTNWNFTEMVAEDEFQKIR